MARDLPAGLASLLLVVLALATGCPRPPDQEKAVVELDPMFLTIVRQGEDLKVESFDLEELLARAEKEFGEKQYSRARKSYQLLARDAGVPEVRALAFLNVALCDLALEEPGLARAALEEAGALASDEATLVSIGLVELEAMAQMGEWALVADRGEALLGRLGEAEWLGRVHLLIGQSRQQEGNLEGADAHYRMAHQAILEGQRVKEQHGNAVLAEAWFRRGMVLRRLFDQIELKLPVERMTIELSDKLALMRQAEELLLAGVQTRNEKWSPRAGHEAGMLYHGFAMSLLQAEIPTDLNELELEVYTAELNKKVLPLLQRARHVLQENVRMCTTSLFFSPWVERSKEQVRELDALIERIGGKQ